MDQEAWWATVHEVTKSQTLNNSGHVRWAGVWDGGDTCTPMADSCQCMAKITTML